MIYTVATVLALQLPKTAAARAPAGPLQKAELHSAGVVVAASAMALLRASLGFLTFQIAFVFRRAHYATIWFAMVLVFAALGTLAGNGAGPRLRRVMEETMLIFSLTCAAVLGIVAAAVPGRFVAGMLAGGVGFAAASGRLAFDSIVQRDAPAANHGRAFAQFETRFQVAWVLAAFVPILIPIPAAAGFALVGVTPSPPVPTCMHTLRTRTLPERLEGARRELRRRRAWAAATLDSPDPTNRLPAPWTDPTAGTGTDPTSRQMPLPTVRDTKAERSTPPQSAPRGGRNIPWCRRNAAASRSELIVRAQRGGARRRRNVTAAMRRRGSRYRLPEGRGGAEEAPQSVRQFDAGEPEAGSVDFVRRGQLEIGVPQSSQAVDTGPFADPGDETVPALDLSGGDAQPEQAFDEAIGLIGFEPAAAHRFGDAARRTE